MQSLARTESAALKSAADELIRAYQALHMKDGALIEDAARTALRHLRAGSVHLARTTLERALQENKL